MKIRSVTLFVEPDRDAAGLAGFVATARHAFPVPVQTTRLATTPFPTWLHGPDQAVALATAWKDAGIDYLSLGPVQLDHDPAWLEQLPLLLSLSDHLFASAEIAGMDGQIDLARCYRVAHVIRQNSTLLDNGFGNLYFAALAHCPPGSPFFPVAYHAGGPPAFALAVEAAGLARQAMQASSSLQEARTLLVGAIEREAARLEEVARSLEADHGPRFAGIDFSLAPFPDEETSLAGALEDMGVACVGAPGSLFAAAFIAEAIGRARFSRCGFSGLMLPVLEDAVLARRVAQGKVGLAQLLSYAAVCGVGLDTIPLPGDTPEAAIAGILLDLAALAARLGKPLTARLMPLPGLQAGDPVTFDFPYFAGSRVMPLPGDGPGGLLARPARLPLEKARLR